ncbi:MAG: Trm112 family protein [Chthoniobacterales bacterium]|jgi:uncharacterized protein YbaR (Trm112 family)
MEFLIGVARCPRTGQRLRLADGHVVTEDGRLGYPIEDGIPVLLAEEALERLP